MRAVVNRRIGRGGIVIALALVLAGCGPITQLQGQPSPVAASQTPTDPPTTTTTPPPTTTPTPTVDFTPAVDRAVAAVHDGELSLAVFDRATNTMVAQYHDEQPYYTESVVKLLIGLDALNRGDSASEVAEMLSRSDDVTATKLWYADGAAAIVSRWAAKIGLHHTTPPAGEWGNTRTTAADLVKLYQYILTDIPAGERDVIVKALRAATNLGADGTDQYFGIPYAVGKRAPWAVKQGWACCQPGWVLNTTGLVGTGSSQYIVIALSSHDTGAGSAVRRVDSDELTDAIQALLPDLLA